MVRKAAGCHFRSVIALALVAPASAFLAGPAVGGSHALSLRSSAGWNAGAAASRPTHCVRYASSLGLEMSEESATSRRQFLELAGSTAAASLLSGVMGPAAASAAPASDFAGKVTGAPIEILTTIAGGTQKEFDSLKDGFTPGKPLDGFDLQIYQLYKYAATKIPATEDPRASLRPLFNTKMADSLFAIAQASGVKPKVYDARGDGLTNQGKGGVIKGTGVLLEGLKGKGLLEDFNFDYSSHDESSWVQANPSSVTISYKTPAGINAAKVLKEEGIAGLNADLVASTVFGYFKACKVAVESEPEITADGAKVKFNLSWAGKARQKATMERRNADKLNAARGYKKE